MGQLRSMQFWRNQYGRVDDLPSVVDLEEDALGPAQGIMIGLIVALVLWSAIIWGVWEILG